VARLTAAGKEITAFEADVAKCTKGGYYEDALVHQRKLESAIDGLEIMHTLAQWARREVSKESAALHHVEEQRDFIRSAKLRDHIAKVVRWAETGYGDLCSFPNYAFKQKMRETRQASTRTVVQERSAQSYLIPLAQVISITVTASSKETLQREKVERSTLEVDSSIEVHAPKPPPPPPPPKQKCLNVTCTKPKHPLCWRWYCYPRMRVEKRLKYCCQGTAMPIWFVFVALVIATCAVGGVGAIYGINELAKITPAPAPPVMASCASNGCPPGFGFKAINTHRLCSDFPDKRCTNAECCEKTPTPTLHPTTLSPTYSPTPFPTLPPTPNPTDSQGPTAAPTSPTSVPTQAPVRRHSSSHSLSLSHSRTLSLTHCLSPSHLPHPPISHIDGDGGHVRAVGGADYLWAFVRANIETDGSTHVSNDSAYEGTGASSFLFSLSHARSLSLTVSLPLISRLLPSLT